MLDALKQNGYNRVMPKPPRKPMTNPVSITEAEAAGRTRELARAMRRRLGLSQIALSRRIGVPSQTVSRIETGALAVSPRYLTALELLTQVEAMTEEVARLRATTERLQEELSACRLVLADEGLDNLV